MAYLTEKCTACISSIVFGNPFGNWGEPSYEVRSPATPSVESAGGTAVSGGNTGDMAECYPTLANADGNSCAWVYTIHQKWELPGNVPKDHFREKGGVHIKVVPANVS